MKSFPNFELLDTSGIDESLNILASIGGVDEVTSLGMAIHAVACPLPDYVLAVMLFDINANKPVIRVTSRYFREHFKDFATKQHSAISVRLSHENKHCTIIAIELEGQQDA